MQIRAKQLELINNKLLVVRPLGAWMPLARMNPLWLPSTAEPGGVLLNAGIDASMFV